MRTSTSVSSGLARSGLSSTDWSLICASAAPLGSGSSPRESDHCVSSRVTSSKPVTVGEFYYNTKHYGAARYYYDQVVKDHPQSRFADLARARIDEVKHGGDTAGVAWAPLQAAFYARLFRRWAADDPLWQTLADRNLYVPAVGGGTTVLGSPSTRAQRYWLNQQSGAQIRTTLAAQVEWLRAADRAAAQDWVGQVAERAHKDAKRQLEEYYRR